MPRFFTALEFLDAPLGEYVLWVSDGNRWRTARTISLPSEEWRESVQREVNSLTRDHPWQAWGPLPAPAPRP